MAALQMPAPVQPDPVQATCANCAEYDRGICRLKAESDWGNAAKVKRDRPACHFATILPF